MKYKVPLGNAVSSTEHRKHIDFCKKHFGKRGQAWTSVWVNGVIYGFRKEAHAVFFTLKFKK